MKRKLLKLSREHEEVAYRVLSIAILSMRAEIEIVKSQLGRGIKRDYSLSMPSTYFYKGKRYSLEELEKVYEKYSAYITLGEEWIACFSEGGHILTNMELSIISDILDMDYDKDLSPAFRSKVEELKDWLFEQI